jgi:tetratricopeptide (TPR) repeat protein
VLLVSPNSLGNCPNAGDWLRLEIEEAMKLERNILKLVDVDMNFHSEEYFMPTHLREKFSSYSGLPYKHPYFELTIDQLVNTLSRPLTRNIEIITLPPEEQQAAQQRIAHIAASPAPTPDHLLAEYLYGRAHNDYSSDRPTEELVADYTEAIRLNPQFAAAVYRRGRIRDFHMSDYEGAIADYTEAIRLNPQYADAYYNRGIIYEERKKDYQRTLADFQKYLDLGGSRRQEVEGWIADLKKKLR